MEVIEVKDITTESQFFQIPELIYQSDSNWIPQLHTDVRQILNPESNPAFEHGDCKCLMLRVEGIFVARLAVFYTQEVEFRKGGIGFYECIDDQAAAHCILSYAQAWLIERRVEEVEALINFGERDRYWGVLTAGFYAPAFQDNYNPPYYQEQLESFGFVKKFEQFTFLLNRKEFKKERIEKIVERVKRDYRFESLKLSQAKKYAADFTEVYNRAWSGFDHFKPLNPQQVHGLLRSMKPIMKPGFVQFAYSGNQPIGFFVNIADINPFLKHAHGKLSLYQRLRIWVQVKRGAIPRIRGIVFGIDPDFQNRGIESGLIDAFYEALKKYPAIQEAELSWIGDFNPRMLKLLEAIGAKKWKTHTTFSKPLN